MIGGDHEHKRVGAMLEDRLQGCYGDCRGGVAANWLENRSAAVLSEWTDVGDDAIGMPLGRYQVDWGLTFGPGLETPNGLRKHGSVAGNVVELLGIVFARERP